MSQIFFSLRNQIISMGSASAIPVICFVFCRRYGYMYIICSPFSLLSMDRARTHFFCRTSALQCPHTSWHSPLFFFGEVCPGGWARSSLGFAGAERSRLTGQNGLRTQTFFEALLNSNHASCLTTSSTKTTIQCPLGCRPNLIVGCLWW